MLTAGSLYGVLESTADLRQNVVYMDIKRHVARSEPSRDARAPSWSGRRHMTHLAVNVLMATLKYYDSSSCYKSNF